MTTARPPGWRSRVPHSVSVASGYVRTSVQNELQYRSNFFLQIAQSMFQIVTGVVVVALVFRQTSELNGWTRAELLAAIGVFTVISGVVRTFVQPCVEQLMYGIEEGEFDFVLTRPADSQLLVSVRAVNVWQLADVLVGFGIVVVALPDLPAGLGLGDVVAFVALLVVGVVIAYCMWFAVATMAFRVIKLPAVDNLFYFVGRSAQYPIGIYPTWFRLALTAVVPLGIAVTAPAEAVTSRLSWGTLVAALTVMVVSIVLCRFLWQRGVRHYSSASS
ncbi:ABC-2 family transporter protein [soil metagenome]